jgi:hypothetical protein
MKLFEEYLRPLREFGIGRIAKETLIEEFSKKRLQRSLDFIQNV